ncbi:LexA family protein [Chitinilyticum litopenaei]|uniref:LexA family protein n=1 Tax=Chitinilyticum litopenaei TaxID=1121276 RepID=UPI000409D2EB|nr:translesion error-prone DNA polymerase V autoproteolytic subunit [Chitinilyticum litopenaei]
MTFASASIMPSQPPELPRAQGAHPCPPLLALPRLDTLVPAGFPSPAEDWADERVDLNRLLVRDPESTFFLAVSGDSMCGSDPARSIPDGALLVVDRTRQAVHDDIVVALIDNDFTVKRLFRRGRHLALVAENPAYLPLVAGEGQEIAIWGVVTAWIMRPR